MTPNRSIGLLLSEILPFYLIADLQRVGSDFFSAPRTSPVWTPTSTQFLPPRGREGGGRIGASFFPNLAEGGPEGVWICCQLPLGQPRQSLFKAIWFVQQVPQERPRRRSNIIISGTVERALPYHSLITSYPLRWL